MTFAFPPSSGESETGCSRAFSAAVSSVSSRSVRMARRRRPSRRCSFASAPVNAGDSHPAPTVAIRRAGHGPSVPVLAHELHNL